MARRMYDLDNGIENIKVKSVETDIIIGAYGYSCTIDDEGITFQHNDDYLLNVNVAGTYFYSPVRFSLYTTELRPTPAEGSVIYDSTLKKCILYNGTAWVNLDGTVLS